MSKHDSLWIFVADGARFPGGVFVDLKEAECWIAKHALTGILTLYPVNEGVYDWALRTGHFRPNPLKVADSKFVGRFTTASQEHFHYQGGVKASDSVD